MKALVLSGGGCKGAYQAGAILHLMNNLGLKFDIICGSSVGAINAAFLAQYPKENFQEACNDLVKFWLDLEQKQIYKNWFPFGRVHSLWKQSLYNSQPLENLIEEIIDVEKLKNSGVFLRVGTVSVNTGEYKVYNQRAINIKKAITASASFPPYFFPVKIEDDYEYDAGLREYTPIKAAIDAGAKEIYIISTEPKDLPIINAKKLKTFGLFKRFINTLAYEVIVNDFNQLQKTNKDVLEGTRKDKRFVDCKLILPKEELVEDALNFNHKIITKLIQVGYNDSKEIIK